MALAPLNCCARPRIIPTQRARTTLDVLKNPLDIMTWMGEGIFSDLFKGKIVKVSSIVNNDTLGDIAVNVSSVVNNNIG
jgi:hypothetical protein